MINLPFTLEGRLTRLNFNIGGSAEIWFADDHGTEAHIYYDFKEQSEDGYYADDYPASIEIIRKNDAMNTSSRCTGQAPWCAELSYDREAGVYRVDSPAFDAMLHIPHSALPDKKVHVEVKIDVLGYRGKVTITEVDSHVYR